MAGDEQHPGQFFGDVRLYDKNNIKGHHRGTFCRRAIPRVGTSAARAVILWKCCDRWLCPDCGPRKRREIREVALSGILAAEENVVMSTLMTHRADQETGEVIPVERRWKGTGPMWEKYYGYLKTV